MTTDLTTITLKTFFRFPFSGPGWQNRLMTGMALSLGVFFIPILPSLLVEGYALRIMRQTSGGEAPSLPEWNDWGGLLLDGLKMMVVRILYLLPGYLLMVGAFVVYMFSFFLLPLTMGLMESSGRGSSSAASGMLVLVMFLSMGIMFVGLALGSLLLLLGALPLPVALARLAQTGKLGAAFELRQITRLLRANKLGFLIAWVISAGLLYLISITVMLLYYSLVLMCLAPFVLIPLSYLLGLIAAALFGNGYAQAAANLEASH